MKMGLVEMIEDVVTRAGEGKPGKPGSESTFLEVRQGASTPRRERRL
jgi:hypothetical protein